MEPLAPGTEDEPPVSFSTSTKQEKERERLLAVKAWLPSGKYGNVYEFKYINGAENWYCNACACPVMGWVFHHETGKRHSIALGTLNKDRFGNALDADGPSAIQIAPGEPAPPGFEGQVEKVALIQERLDVFTVGPLVALEYLLELRDYDPSKEPTYLCVLCDKKGDPRTVLTHLASYKHILQYLQKHFPTCYRALAPYMTKQYKRNWQSALHEIAEAIEKKFGRLKPIPVNADKYEKDKIYYLEHIAKSRHFSELSGYTFEELVNRDELTRQHEDEIDKYGYDKSYLPQSQRKKSPSPPVVANPIKKVKSHGQSTISSAAVGSRRRSLSSVSSITSSDLSDFEGPSERRVKRSRSPPNYRSPYGRRYKRMRSPPSNHRDEIYKRDKDLMPWEKPNYRRQSSGSMSKSEAAERARKMEEYKKLCKAIDNDMERVLKNHQKNPEKHPQYNDEWKKFWNKRYKELQQESKDVSTHDFKPEWIEFWNKRMAELHQDEVKTKKDALRKRLGLPEEPAPISFRIGNKKKFDPNKLTTASSSASQGDHNEVIVIDDRDDESKSSRRSHSPWEEDVPIALRRRSSSRVSRDRSRERDYHHHHKQRRRSSRERRSRSRSFERDYKSSKYEGSYGRDRAPPPPPRERIRTTADLPWERDYYRKELPSCYKPPAVMRDVTREPVLPHGKLMKQQLIQQLEDNHDDDDGEVNVVAILRLLTALEEKLGSLGPKVIDLLAQALAMEKSEANSSETLMDNDVNCVLFETVKEKLKGQLLAGLVEPIQEKAFKNAIKKTASLIHMSGERKKDKEKLLAKVDPVKVPGVGTVDKAAIAKQIANALVLQGKTDVTQAELEQLINAVVGMAEASKNSNKPITTASFLNQINNSGGTTNEEKSPTSSSASIIDKKDDFSYDSRPLAATNMEGLSDSDLQTLLQNFKDLSTEEQHGLINYLKKLEALEPDRVERLRKFVNLGGPKPSEQSKQLLQQQQQKEQQKQAKVEKRRDSGRESPFSNRMGSGANPSVDDKRVEEEKCKKMMAIDSDEEDYSFDDVVKAASKNVKQKELEKEREIVEESINKINKQEEIDLDETKALINNIMSNINKSEVTTSTTASATSVSADFAKTFNNIPVNMANLANIVGSVQNMSGKTNNTPPVASVNKMNFDLVSPSQYQPKVVGTAMSRNDFLYGQPQQSPSFYQQNQQQRQFMDNARPGGINNRPAVGYPIDKVSYPGYGYGQPQPGQMMPSSQQQLDGFGRGRGVPQQQPQNFQYPGGYGRGNVNNYNNNNRW